jgi:hypothetical protein|tara:strand:+ start:28268 stop:28498 length:231 start_codon:yes stop_codon:yes gene_type:complete
MNRAITSVLNKKSNFRPFVAQPRTITWATLRRAPRNDYKDFWFATVGCPGLVCAGRAINKVDAMKQAKANFKEATR